MTLKLDQLRAEFPALARRISGRPLVYLDNAATSLRPTRVLDAELDFYRQGGANVHRGKHALSEEASEAFESARESIADHLGAQSPREIVFVANATHGLNLVASGLRLSKEDEVIAAPVEHHSNLLPWMRAASVKWVETEALEPIRAEQVRALISKRTRAIVIGHASNVTGVIQPVAEICQVAREAGLVSVVDGAQSTPHLKIDVQQLGCDFFVFSGHKALGPMGTGVLYGRSEQLERLEPLMLGGGTAEKVEVSGYRLRSPPQRLEAGTPNVAGAIALAEALRFLKRLGFDEIAAHDARLAQALEDGLGPIRGLTLLMAKAAPRLPIASVLVGGLSIAPDELSLMLSDRYAIMTRSGFHCAHPLFDRHGWIGGALRASCHVYNSVDEVEALCYAARELAAAFGR